VAAWFYAQFGDTTAPHVEQEQWEHWRAERKLESESKHRERFCGAPGYHPEKILRLCMQNSAIQRIFGRKMVRNAVHNVFLNTLTMTFLRVPLERPLVGAYTSNSHLGESCSLRRCYNQLS